MKMDSLLNLCGGVEKIINPEMLFKVLIKRAVRYTLPSDGGKDY